MLFGIVALVAGVSAVVVIYKLVENYEQKIAAAQAPDDTVLAVMAGRDLYQGITITEDDLVQIKIPPEFLPGGSEEGIYLAPEHVVGRVPRERILANEFIRESRLADPESGTGLNALIPRGMRAISINIADGQALSGFLNPADYVDIVVTIDPDEGDKIAETHTLVQAVYVLAVNDKSDNETKKVDPAESRKKRKKGKKRMKPSVTVAVAPDQAEAIAHAEKQGEITLTLRNKRDLIFDDELSEGADIFTVLNREREPDPPPAPVRTPTTPKPPPPVVEPDPPKQPGLIIIKGTDVQQQD